MLLDSYVLLFAFLQNRGMYRRLESKSGKGTGQNLELDVRILFEISLCLLKCERVRFVFYLRKHGCEVIGSYSVIRTPILAAFQIPSVLLTL